jgi:hypothetical protein
MRGQRTMLWTGISLVTGVVCLGVGEPQSSKGGQAVSSVEASRGLDGTPMVLIPPAHSPWALTTVSQTSGLNTP